MASSFNRVILMGNLTRDVEVKYLQSGMAVAEVSLAVSDGHKDGSGKWVEETSFFDVVLWSRSAEIAAEYLGKGSPMQVEGRLKQETWEKEGQKRSKVKVIAEKLILLPTGRGGGSRGDSTSQDGPTEDQYPQTDPAPVTRARQPATAAAAAAPTPTDDIPFGFLGFILSLATVGSGFIS